MTSPAPLAGGTRRILLTLAVLLAALGATDTARAAAPTTWLCKPGLANNPCTPSLTTTRVTTKGEVGSRIAVRKVAKPKVDCFYVYPTVSDQPGLTASRRVDPEQRSIALYQAGRYSSECRVYAPIYRQITLAGLLKPDQVTDAMRLTAYGDVRDAFREYLRKDNKGRGIVLIGHSQGTFMLRKLVAEEIDPKPTVRKQLVSAILLGGNVTVKKGSDVGGDFKHVRACRSSTQVGCVVAFSTFNDVPPNPSRFGRPSRALGVGPADTSGLEVLCTNPAALSGGTAKITAIFPSAPFAPGTSIGGLTGAVGFPMPKVSTAFVQADDAFSARCSAANGANVLLLSGAEQLVARPDPTWGLHLTDANIALGDLVALVAKQTAAYARR